MKKFIILFSILLIGCIPEWPGDAEATCNIQKNGVNVWGLYQREDMYDKQKAYLAALASKLVQDAWYEQGKPGAEAVDSCLDNVMFYIVEDETFHDITGYSEEYVGAAYWEFNIHINDHAYFPVYVKETEYYNSLHSLGWTFIHEFIHVALYCQRVDISHDERYFWNYDEQANSKETVEWEAVRQLGFHLEHNPDFQEK